jgi:putative ABC transport system permease protein
MFKNYLKTALRNIGRNKLYSAINIFGLMIGLAACLLIGVYISHELSYDKFHANADRIVRATMEYSRSGTVSGVATTGTKVGPQFKRSFPSVEEYVRTYITTRVVKNDDKIFEENRFLYADDAFFKIFSFKLLEGNAATALNAPDKIVLTQSAAKKYFGNASALNKSLSIKDKPYTVSAICEDVPQNSQIKFDLVTQFLNLGDNVKEEQWFTANWITYFLLLDEKEVKPLQKQADEYMASKPIRADVGMEGTDYLRYNLEPLKKVHLYSSLAGFEPNGSITYIYMFAVIAVLILIIAIANYTNLATAQSVGRSGEIGMRKVMGASKKQVFLQFIGESSAITTIAALLAFGLSLLLVPYFNTITGKLFTVYDLLRPMPVVSIIVFAIIVSFLAGAYPAFVLSGTQLIGVLKKGFNFTGSNNMLRKGLIVAQFAISVFLITYTVIILQQMSFLKEKNLGYDKDHLLILPVDNKIATNFSNIKEALAQVKGVEAVTAAYETPEYIQWGDGIKVTDEKGVHDISLNALPVDLDFTKTMKMQLLAGRDFQQTDFALMDTSNDGANYRDAYIINETLAKKIGWTAQQAINKTIEKAHPGAVVGVVKDFNFESLHEPVKPLVIFLSRDLARTFIIRVTGTDIPSTLARLETLWKQRVPHRPFEYHFMDEDYNRLYLSEQRSSALFSVAAGLAILLACLGLFGLAAFTTVQRTKEIGIRRVLGANVSSIVVLVAKNFLGLVAIAILVSVPLAWYAGNQWLQDFAFRVPVQAWVFIATGLVTILIALATVSFHSIKSALINPVKSLKTE